MNASNQKTFILHVDDTPEELTAWCEVVQQSGDVKLDPLHPDDIKEDHLRQADLVLVDFKLDSWPRRDALRHLSLRPANGIALLTILQEHNHQTQAQRPCAFALYTGVIGEVSRGLVSREHLVARAHNLEWVFRKQGDQQAQAMRVLALARAVQALPKNWPWKSPEDAARALWQWLAVPEDEPWAAEARRAVMQCHPPAHEFAEHTHGIAVLRWFLHRILPYPCFLFDEAHLAARLRVTRASLRASLARGGALKRLLEPAIYRGQLAEFIGPRWWRAGVEAEIFALVSDDPGDISLLKKRLKERDGALETYTWHMTVPVLNEKYEFQEDLITIDDAVLVQPDDWPPYADQAWTSSELAEGDEVLKAIVVKDP